MNSLIDFNSIKDYIYILNGAISADLIILFIVYYTTFWKSTKNLMRWYEKYRLSAVIADVLILVIVFIIARWIFTYYKLSWNIYKFIGIILSLQIIHDLLFYKFFSSVPRGVNKMLDLFKDYSKEIGVKAILGDSFMVIIFVLLTVFYSKLSINQNIIINIITVYLIPYIIYTK